MTAKPDRIHHNKSDAGMSILPCRLHMFKDTERYRVIFIQASRDKPSTVPTVA